MRFSLSFSDALAVKDSLARRYLVPEQTLFPPINLPFRRNVEHKKLCRPTFIVYLPLNFSVQIALRYKSLPKDLLVFERMDVTCETTTCEVRHRLLWKSGHSGYSGQNGIWNPTDVLFIREKVAFSA